MNTDRNTVKQFLSILALITAGFIVIALLAIAGNPARPNDEGRR